MTFELDTIHVIWSLYMQGNRAELTEEQLQQVWTHGPDTVVEQSLAQTDAQELYQAGEKKRWGTDESAFLRIMAIRNFYQLRATFNEYWKVNILGLCAEENQ